MLPGSFQYVRPVRIAIAITPIFWQDISGRDYIDKQQEEILILC